MIQIIRVLNNNSLLVIDKKTGQEKILLGKGIGFGKKKDQELDQIGDAKEYELKSNYNSMDIESQVNVIDPVYLEAAGQIIEEAEVVFDHINRDILVLLAEHIAFAAKREKENIFIPNPFISDIKAIFSKEYMVALNGREKVEQLSGYRMSEDEVGFIALHIHSGLVGERVSETLRNTQIIDASVQIIAKKLKKNLQTESMTYSRLITHMYYLLERVRIEEPVKIELNEFIVKQYPEAWNIAGEVCDFISKQLEKQLDTEERGFLAIYIERFRTYEE